MFGRLLFCRVYLNGGFSNYNTKRWNQKLVGNTNKLGGTDGTDKISNWKWRFCNKFCGLGVPIEDKLRGKEIVALLKIGKEVKAWERAGCGPVYSCGRKVEFCAKYGETMGELSLMLPDWDWGPSYCAGRQFNKVVAWRQGTNFHALLVAIEK